MLDSVGMDMTRKPSITPRSTLRLGSLALLLLRR
jgi:hypothetical protein